MKKIFLGVVLVLTLVFVGVTASAQSAPSGGGGGGSIPTSDSAPALIARLEAMIAQLVTQLNILLARQNNSGLTLVANTDSYGEVNLKATFDQNKIDPISVTLRAVCPAGVFLYYGESGINLCNSDFNMDFVGAGVYKKILKSNNYSNARQTVDFKAFTNGNVNSTNYAFASVIISNPNNISPKATSTGVVSFVEKPTLKLVYDRNRNESRLDGSGTVTVQAGANDVLISYLTLTISDKDGRQVFTNAHTTSFQGINNTVKESVPSQYGTNNDAWRVKAGTKATFSIQTSENPQVMFAGTYTLSLGVVGILDKSGISAYDQLAYQNLKSLPVTIIGEKSPYITNATVKGDSVTVVGNRLYANSSKVYVNGVYKGPLKIGYSEIGQQNVTGTFPVSWLDKSEKGGCTLYGNIQIEDPKYGKSNSFGVSRACDGSDQKAQINISWANGSDNVKIGLVDSRYDKDGTVLGWISLNNKMTGSLVWDGLNVTDLTGTVIWPVKSLSQGPYRILGSSANSAGNYCSNCNDVLSDSFNISNSAINIQLTAFNSTTQPSVTVISPNGGEQIKTGEKTVIKWTGANPNKTVRINLNFSPIGYTYNNVQDTLSFNAPDTGSFAWIPSEFYLKAIVPGSFSVNIVRENSSDSSDRNFNIVQGNLATRLNVTSPRGGETFTPGQTVSVSWNPSVPNSQYGFAILKKGDDSIAKWDWLDHDNNGYKWTVPRNLSYGDYYLRISELSTNSNAGDVRGNIGYSNSFTINSSVTAPVTLTVSKTGTGTGIVSGATSIYSIGSTATLRAIPSSGSTFTGWSGACSGGETCSIVMNGNKEVTATFTKNPEPVVDSTVLFSLTTTQSANGIIAGAVKTNLSGSTVYVSALPNPGYAFSSWTGNACSNSVITGTCKIVMNENKTVGANFIPVTGQMAPNPNVYSLTTSITGTGGVIIGAANSYINGSTANLTAKPLYGSVFTGWGGACSGTGACSIIMNENKTVNANFRRPAVSAPTASKAEQLNSIAAALQAIKDILKRI